MRPSYTFEITSQNGEIYYTRQYTEENAVKWFHNFCGGKIGKIRFITTILDIVYYGTTFKVVSSGEIYTKINGMNSKYNAMNEQFQLWNIDVNAEIQILDEPELVFKNIKIGQRFNLKQDNDCE